MFVHQNQRETHAIMNRRWLVRTVEVWIKKRSKTVLARTRSRERSTRYIASTSTIEFKFNSQLNFDHRKRRYGESCFIGFATITDEPISCTCTHVHECVHACLIRRDWLDSRRSNSNACEAYTREARCTRNKSYCNESGL